MCTDLVLTCRKSLISVSALTWTPFLPSHGLWVTLPRLWWWFHGQLHHPDEVVAFRSESVTSMLSFGTALYVTTYAQYENVLEWCPSTGFWSKCWILICDSSLSKYGKALEGNNQVSKSCCAAFAIASLCILSQLDKVEVGTWNAVQWLNEQWAHFPVCQYLCPPVILLLVFSAMSMCSLRGVRSQGVSKN